jgi:hypothetical protein
MEDSKVIEGGCLCGKTRYRATGEPYKVSYCHCTSCRRATGAPIAAWLMFDKGQVIFPDTEPQKFASSPGILRGFCATCGTPLWWEGQWDDKSIEMVTSGSLDDPELYRPDRHASCSNQISWFETADDLPRYPHSSPKD